MAPMRSAGARIAEGLLIVLAFALPFEAPLFALGPLEITTVELVLYAALAAWGIGVAVEVARARDVRAALVDTLRDGLARAAVLWVLVLFVSAAAAPSYRAAALKFSLRTLSGVLAFFAVRSLGRRPGVARLVLLALVAGGLLSAASGVLDGFVPASAPLWRLFHRGTFDAMGLRRASGVFEYPTIGAMYWEAVVPLLVVAPLSGELEGSPRAPLEQDRRELEGSPRAALDQRAFGALRMARFGIPASAVLLLAIFASATRSALAGVAISCGLLAVVGRRFGWPVARAAAGPLGVLVVLLAVGLRPGGSGSPLGQRLRWWHDDRWFGVQYEVPATARTTSGGEVFAVPITLHNTGSIAWRAEGERPTNLSYHWALAPGGGSPSRLVEFEGRRTALPSDVAPGGVVQIVAVARAPTVAGRYRLSWDLVQENVTWFSDRGNPPGEQVVDVRATGPAAPLPEIVGPVSAPPSPSRPGLWRAALVLWRERPLLGVGPDNFRRRYQAVMSLPPGRAPYTDDRLHANSLYFETLADLGLAGALGLTALAIALVRSLRRHWTSGCLAGLGCAVAALSFFVHGLLDYFFEFTPLYGLFWVLLGLTAAFAPEPSASPAPPDSSP
jgi:hypothetical protein